MTLRRTSLFVVVQYCLSMCLMMSAGRVKAAFVGRYVSHGNKWRRLRIASQLLLSTASDDGDDDATNESKDTSTMNESTRLLMEGALGRMTQTMSTKSRVSDEMDSEFNNVQSLLRDLKAATTAAASDDAARDSLGSDKQQIPAQQSMRVSVDSLLQGAVDRAMRTLSTKAVQEQQGAQPSTSEARAEQQADPYLSNPAITPTALAHQMWSSVIRPNVDTVIDATCGNGNDSVAIASMLFNDNDDDPFAITEPQLLCIDIQQEACDTTRSRLAELLHMDIMTCNVNVLCTSHSPLPRPRDESSVGLVCWNLGYLPQSDRAMLTQMESTIASIADAALMVRVGGMISVATYPRSNKNEDFAVHALLEGLALLTSKSTDWRRDYMDELGPDPDSKGSEDEYSVRDTVRLALERIVEEGPPKQTWRVLQNKMLGRPQSPILLTATRIK